MQKLIEKGKIIHKWFQRADIITTGNMYGMYRHDFEEYQQWEQEVQASLKRTKTDFPFGLFRYVYDDHHDPRTLDKDRLRNAIVRIESQIQFLEQLERDKKPIFSTKLQFKYSSKDFLLTRNTGNKIESMGFDKDSISHKIFVWLLRNRKTQSSSAQTIAKSLHLTSKQVMRAIKHLRLQIEANFLGVGNGDVINHYRGRGYCIASDAHIETD